MLRSILLYMQRQPKAVRNQYAFAVSGLFTGIIALIWVFTQASVPAASSLATDANTDTERTPFSTLIEQSKKQFAAARSAFQDQDIGTSTESESVETPVNASTLILSDETITDAAEAEAEDPYITAATTSAGQVVRITTATTSSAYREVQIATTSAPN
jgi:hypothetical protein